MSFVMLLPRQHSVQGYRKVFGNTLRQQQTRALIEALATATDACGQPLISHIVWCTGGAHPTAISLRAYASAEGHVLLAALFA